MMLLLISIILLCTATVMFGHLSFRTAKMWRQLKEEVLFHFMLIYFVIALLCLGFIALFTVLRPLPFSISFEELFYFGIFYELFYLELSYIYTTLFSNTRKVGEKYLTYVIAATILMNIVAGTSGIDIYNLIGTAMHMIAISIGLYIIFRTYRHLKNNERYFTRKAEIDFVKYLERVVLFVFVMFVIDGIGFLIWFLFASNGIFITEIEILFFATMTFIFTGTGYWLINNAGKKAKGCDLLLILNTIS